MLAKSYPKIFLLTTFLPVLLMSTNAGAATQENDKIKIYDTFTLYWENDAFAGTDRDYTNGLKMTWSTPYGMATQESHLPKWSNYFINNLPFVNNPATHQAVSISLGQNIYTPEKVLQQELIVDDRPYAGYLYHATGFHNRSVDRKNSWEFQIGVVGPLSLAEESQNWSHDQFGAKRSGGWDNQLHNEFTFEAFYESQWLLFSSGNNRGYNYDLIPHLGIGAGSITTFLNVGAEIRFGLNLPDNFGSCPIRGGCATNSAFNNAPHKINATGFTGWHVFFAVDGRAILHDIFLDGNNFEDSHSVDKETLIADVISGVVFEFHHTMVTYSYIYRTKQFKTQSKNQVFGSISLSWTFH